MNLEEYKINYDLEKDYWWFVGVRRMVHRLLDLSNASVDDAKVLDIGCGTGALMDELVKRGGDVWGLDISPEALEFCEQRNLSQLVQGSAEILPFANAEFDTVVAIGVIEHLVEDEKFLAEVNRVLKPGGTFVMLTSSAPGLWSMHDVANHHQRRYLLRDLKKTVIKHSFTVVRFSHLNFILYPFLAPMLLLNRLIYGLEKEAAHRILPVPPKLINAILTAIVLLEARLMILFPLPFGISMIGAFKKQ